ncbi:MAG: hypothetical protein ACKO2K_07780, partial [Alphaproteobacteria bacterium]
MLFKYRADAIPPEERVGKLGHVVVSCVAILPLQTPCYAALTLALHERTSPGQWRGFAHRCVGYAMHHICKGLDEALGGGGGGLVARGACRVRLLLRYLAIMGRTGAVEGFQSGQAADPDKLTVFGLLSILVEAARGAQRRDAHAASHLLAGLVLSTLPYVTEYVPHESMAEWILRPIEALLAGYKSSFSPGTGSTAILLKEEQDDGEAANDDEEEEDDDDEDDEPGGQVCDSLQDLLRVAAMLRGPSRFALPVDSPWKGLTQTTTPNPESGETETTSLTFTDEPIYLSVSDCHSLRFLVAGDGHFQLVPFSLDGVVFGRLPIFGSPPTPGEDEDEEEEM